MAELNWLNSNMGRSFPFLERTVGEPVVGPVVVKNLPDAVIVDCGFIMGVASGFVAALHTVKLARIRRIGTTFLFDFECDAPGLVNNVLTFSRSSAAERFETEFSEEEVSESGSASDSASESADCTEPLWSGYLITGDLDELILLLSIDGSIEGGDNQGVVEPALLQNLNGAFVESVNLANDDRTRTTGAEGCADPSWPYAVGGVFVNARCLQGEVPLVPGFNMLLRQNKGENSLTFVAARGAGAGEVCNEVPLFSGEAPPPGGTLLDGSLACGEVLRSVNGVGGALFNFIRGLGAAITPDPDNHTVLIDVNMFGLALCFESIAAVSES